MEIGQLDDLSILLQHYKRQQQQDSPSRTAFSLSPIHARRDASRITAVAMDSRTQHVFLGLSTGQVEEHQLLAAQPPWQQAPHTAGDTTPSSSCAGGSSVCLAAPGAPIAHPPAAGQRPHLRLVAGRKVSRHGVLDLCCLPSISSLVALCGDGSVVVSPYDGAALWALPRVKHAALIAGDGTTRAPARLAVVVRASSTLGGLDSGPGAAAGKLLVYSVAAASSPHTKAPVSKGQTALLLAQVPLKEPVHALSWVGDAVFLATASGYQLVRRGGAGAAAVVTEIAPNPGGVPMLGSPFGQHKEALLLFGDRMVVVTDNQGAAVCAPLLLPDRPLLLVSVGWPLLEGGGTHPCAAPAYDLQPAAAPVAVAGAAQGMMGGRGEGGGLLYSGSVVSTSSRGSSTFEAALDNSDAACVQGSSERAAAGGAHVPSRSRALYVVGVVDEGVCVLDQQSGRRLQFIPFAHDDAWLQAAQRMPGAVDCVTGTVLLATSATLLCLQPQPLEAQVHQLLRHHQYAAAQELIDACEGVGGLWVTVARTQLAMLQMQVLCFSDACANLLRVPPQVFQPAQLLHLFPDRMARWLPDAPHKRFWGLHHHHVQRGLEGLVGEWLEVVAASQPPPASGLYLGSKQQQRLKAWALAAAKQQLVRYLRGVRGRQGLVLREALDTLLLLLLCEVGAHGQLEAAAGSRHAACVDAVLPVLKQSRRWRALALLWASRSRYQEALDVWEGLSRGTLVEAPAAADSCSAPEAGGLSDNGPVAAAAAAAAAGAGAVGGRHVQAAKGGGCTTHAGEVACGHEAAVAAAVFMAAPKVQPPPPPPGASPQPQLPQHQAARELERRRSAAMLLRAPSLQAQRSGGLPAQPPVQPPLPPPTAHITLYPPGYLQQQQQQQQQQWGLVLPNPCAQPPLLAQLGALDAAAHTGSAAGHATTTLGGPEADECQHGAAAGIVCLLTVPPPLPLPAWMLPDQPRHLPPAPSSSGHAPQPQSLAGPAPIGSLTTPGGDDYACGPVQVHLQHPQSHHHHHHHHAQCARQHPDQQQQQHLEPHVALTGATGASALGLPPSLPPPLPSAPPACPPSSTAQHLHPPAPIPLPSVPVPPDLVLSKLAWLLEVAPLEALRVIRGRAADLHPQGMLAMLADRSDDARWLYLHELVHVQGLSDAALHTELALELIECFVRDAKQQQQRQQWWRRQASAPQEPRAQHTQPSHGPRPDCQAAVFSDYPSPPDHLIPQQSWWPGMLHAPAPDASANADPSAPLSAHCQGLLGVLLAHLGVSQQYDAQIALAAVHEALADLAAAGGGQEPAAAVSTATGAQGAPGDWQAMGVVQCGNADGGMGGHWGVEAAVDRLGGDSDQDMGAGLDDQGYDELGDGGEGEGGGRVGQHGNATQGCSPAQAQLSRVEVVLLQRLRLHADALRVLALRLRDVDAAIAYCKLQQFPPPAKPGDHLHDPPSHGLSPPPLQHQQPPAGVEGASPSVEASSLWLMLLELCLRPGGGARQSYAGALKVLDAQQAVCGAHGSLLLLDPQWVLNALGDDMPLHLAAPTLSRMLCALGHRRRQAQVLRGLHRTQNLAARAERALLSIQRTIVDDTTLCSTCRTPIGDHIFARHPSGAIMCGRCVSKPAYDEEYPR